MFMTLFTQDEQVPKNEDELRFALQRKQHRSFSTPSMNMFLWENFMSQQFTVSTLNFRKKRQIDECSWNKEKSKPQISGGEKHIHQEICLFAKSHRIFYDITSHLLATVDNVIISLFQINAPYKYTEPELSLI